MGTLLILASLLLYGLFEDEDGNGNGNGDRFTPDMPCDQPGINPLWRPWKESDPTVVRTLLTVQRVGPDYYWALWRNPTHPQREGGVVPGQLAGGFVSDAAQGIVESAKEIGRSPAIQAGGVQPVAPFHCITPGWGGEGGGPA